MKICTKCKQSKLEAEFGRRALAKDGLNTYCRQCRSVVDKIYHGDNREKSLSQSQAWRKRNPEKAKANSRRHQLLQYGITVEQFDDMARAQGGVCAICKKPPAGTANHGVLHVDHDHITNKIRGLLCGPCNRAIGLMRDNPDQLVASAYYLTSFEFRSSTLTQE